MDAHPATNLFPMMSDADLQDLADDIGRQGLLQPIILHEGLILDGRNRLKACELAGVEPRFEEWAPTDSPFAWVISTNLHRRHLTTTQREAIAVEAALPLAEEDARKRQTAHLKRGASVPSASIDAHGERSPSHGRAATLAAEAFGVSSVQVQRAKKVKQESPELFEQLKEGKTNVNAAMRQLGARPAAPSRKRQTNDPFPLNSQRAKVIAAAARSRLAQSISSLEGYALGLSELDCGKVAAIATEHEILEWCQRLSAVERAFHELRTRLKEAKQHAQE
jgi:hypothetical protein